MSGIATSMQATSIKSPAILSILFAIASTSCVDFMRGDFSYNTRSENKVHDPEQQIATAERTDGLELFGRGSGRVEDVAFETRVATDLRQHSTPSDGADFDPDIDPTGKLIVFSSTRHATNSHLYIKAVTGATLTQITDGRANDTQPKFDPAGRRIAFASDRGGQWDIWVIDVDGRNPIQITNNPMPELHPSWSPDGKELVYCRVNPKESRGELWVVQLNKPGVKRLIGGGLFPAWSPDGTKIAYQRARTRPGRWFSIWTLDIRDDEVLFPTEVASSPRTALISPAWSPDGRQIAFSMVHSTHPAAFDAGADPTASAQTRADIAIVDLDGRGLQRLTDKEGDNYAPAWSSEGRIFFSARIGGSETIWSVKPFRPVQIDETPSATISSGRRAIRVMSPDHKPSSSRSR